MKIFKITISLIGMLLLSSCGSSMDDNLKKFIKIQCEKSEKFEKQDLGEITQAEVDSFLVKSSKFEEEFEKKYSSEKDRKKIKDLMFEYVKKNGACR